MLKKTFCGFLEPYSWWQQYDNNHKILPRFSGQFPVQSVTRFHLHHHNHIVLQCLIPTCILYQILNKEKTFKTSKKSVLYAESNIWNPFVKMLAIPTVLSKDKVWNKKYLTCQHSTMIRSTRNLFQPQVR